MENNIILVLIIIENLRLIILVKYKLKKKCKFYTKDLMIHI